MVFFQVLSVLCTFGILYYNVAHGLKFKNFRLVLSVILSFIQLNNQLKSTSVSKKGLKIGKMCRRCDQILDHERPVIYREHVMWAWALWMWLFFFWSCIFLFLFLHPDFPLGAIALQFSVHGVQVGLTPPLSLWWAWLSLASGKTSTSLPAIVTGLGTETWPNPANGN